MAPRSGNVRAEEDGWMYGCINRFFSEAVKDKITTLIQPMVGLKLSMFKFVTL